MKCGRPINCGSNASTGELESFDQVVHKYKSTRRGQLAKELRFYKKGPTLRDAIKRAALCLTHDGERHKHQRRIPEAALNKACSNLLNLEKEINGCKNFSDLFDLVEKEINPIRGIGPLTVYDVATRIGSKIGLKPDVIYLHAGTAIGARALLPKTGKATIGLKDLPKAFHRLKPHEVEDCLCIYKEEIQQIKARTSKIG